MKKIIAVLLVLSVMFSAACAKKDSPQSVGMPNPMREVSADEMEFYVNLPEGASDVRYFIIEDGDSKMDQVTYTLDGRDFCYRMQSTKEVASYDMSGIYSKNWKIEDAKVSYCDAVFMTCSDGSVIHWLDAVPGINYTLSCTKQLTSAELSGAADSLFVPMQGEAAGDAEYPSFAESHYEDGNFNTVDVERIDTNAYRISIGLYRLASFEGKGHWEEESLKFTVEAPDGSSIDGRFFPCVEGDGFSLCFTDSKWNLLESGTTFDGFLPVKTEQAAGRP